MMQPLNRKLAVVLILGLLLVACNNVDTIFGARTASDSTAMASAIEAGSGVVADWPAYGATPGGTHFSRAVQITPDNVNDLEVAWVHRSGDFREANWAKGPVLEEEEGGHGSTSRHSQSSLQVTPLVIDETLYYCTPYNRVFALNAITGAEIWSYDPQVDMDKEPVLPNCRGVSSWRSGEAGFCEHRIIMGTLDARLVALDASTGKPCQDFGDNGNVDTTGRLSEHLPAEHSITSPPAILGDRIITGSMVLDNQRTTSPAGVVKAFDVRSGKQLWAWNPVPPGMPQHHEDGTWRSGTTNVWSIISVDEERDMVFLPTGNTTPDYFGGHRRMVEGDLDYYSSSTVALHGETGEIAWHYQMVHHDIWDYDSPAQPTLVDLVVDGVKRAAVVQVTKMGMTFALDRDTGEPLWPVEERPVPQEGAVPEEYLSPTQPFPTHIPSTVSGKLVGDDAWGMLLFDEAACAGYLDDLNNEGIYTPPSVKGSINSPSNGGGQNWGSPAIHPDTGIMVVYTNRVPAYTRLIPREDCEGVSQPQTGTPYCVDTGWLMSPVGVPCTEPPWGTLDAIDLEAGELLWSVPMGTTRNMAPFPFWWLKGLPGLAGPMMTDSGLVFSGISNEHALRAFDVQTGEELWKAELPTAGNAVPMTYQINKEGRQFVVIAAGGHWGGGSPPADYIIAFALPENQDK